MISGLEIYETLLTRDCLRCKIFSDISVCNWIFWRRKCQRRWSPFKQMHIIWANKDNDITNIKNFLSNWLNVIPPILNWFWWWWWWCSSANLLVVTNVYNCHHRHRCCIVILVIVIIITILMIRCVWGVFQILMTVGLSPALNIHLPKPFTPSSLVPWWWWRPPKP